MPTDIHVRWTRFDELFAELLGALEEREHWRGDDHASTALIDATDRLHQIRADLAIARCEVTTDDPSHPCTKDEPASIELAGSADLHTIPQPR